MSPRRSAETSCNTLSIDLCLHILGAKIHKKDLKVVINTSSLKVIITLVNK